MCTCCGNDAAHYAQEQYLITFIFISYLYTLRRIGLLYCNKMFPPAASLCSYRSSEVSEGTCGSWSGSVGLWTAAGHNLKLHRQPKPFPCPSMLMSSHQTGFRISSSPPKSCAAHQKTLSPRSLLAAPPCNHPLLITPSAARVPEPAAAETLAAPASFPAVEVTHATSKSQQTGTSSK